MNTGPGQAETPIDEVIRAILQQAGGSPEAYPPGKASAASLLEAALASTLASPNSSALEWVLIAQAFGSALARAIAQELADSLAPRLMKQVEQILAKHPRTGNGQPDIRQEPARCNRIQFVWLGMKAGRQVITVPAR